MKHLLAVALILLAIPAYAQKVTLPAKLSGNPGMPIPIEADADGKNVLWLTPDKGLVVIDGGFFRGDSKRALLFGAAGVYRLWAFTAKGDVISPRAECIVMIGDVPPGPDPGPGPVPPGPDPFTSSPGCKVLIVYETTELGKMPRAQSEALKDGTIRDYLNTKCVKGPDGKTAQWRIWDQNVDTSAETPLWQAVMKRPRKSLPWIVLSNGRTGYEGPLPADSASTMALLKKYLGA